MVICHYFILMYRVDTNRDILLYAYCNECMRVHNDINQNSIHYIHCNNTKSTDGPQFVPARNSLFYSTKRVNSNYFWDVIKTCNEQMIRIMQGCRDCVHHVTSHVCAHQSHCIPLEKLCGWHLWKWQRVIIGASRFIDPVHMTSHKIQTGAKIRMNEKATKVSTVHHSFDGNRVILQCGAVITWSIFSHKRHPIARAWGRDMRYLLFCLCHCSDLSILWYVGSRYNGTVLYLISTNIRRLINGRYVFCRNLIWPGIAISYSLFSAISQPNPISYVPSSIL